LVITEGPEETVTVYQVQGSNTILGVMFEVALIFDPHLLEVAEIIVLELLVGLGVIVVYDTSTVKHLVLPLTMIGNIATSIVQSTKTINLSLFPLPVINSTGLVIELPLSMALSIFSLSLIPGPIVIVFIYKSDILL
jgi:hypothetical protein